MLIQIKPTKDRRGFVVVDEDGDLHVCPDAAELWGLVHDLFDNNVKVKRPLAGAVLLHLKIGDDEVAVIDDHDDVTICNSGGELWELCTGLFQSSTALAIPAAPLSQQKALTRKPQRLARQASPRRTEEQVIDAQLEDDGDVARTGDGEVVDGKLVCKNDSLVAGVIGAFTGNDTQTEAAMELIRFGRKVNLRSHGGRVRRTRQPRRKRRRG